MAINWKKNKSFKPSVVIAKLVSVQTVNQDGSISYSGFEFHDSVAALHNMIDFGGLNSSHTENIVFQAVRNVAKVDALEKDNLLKEINEVVKKELASKEHRYHILTSLSLNKPYPVKSVNIEGCHIRLLDGDYPEKYTGRSDAMKAQGLDDSEADYGYAKVIISVKAKSEREAATKALRALDLQRSVWCMFANHSMEIFGGSEWHPINKVRMGRVHTVHKNSGKAINHIVWHEPNFVSEALFTHRNFEAFERDTKYVVKQINKSPYGHVLKGALIRSVQALDEKDQNVSLIKLWGALEMLASPRQANYDNITHRVSFLFAERKYHKQILECLRDYRNSSVHAGDQRDRVKTSCYQLQFYLQRLILFHVNTVGDFDTLEDANNFLDLSDNIEALNKRKKLIDMAINFRA